MAVRRCLHGCVGLGGKLYAVGGVGAAYEALDTAEVYDPKTDGWQPLAKMRTVRWALRLAAVGGKIYAIGGRATLSTLDSVEAYDPQLGAWALVASMSELRFDFASVVLDGKIYAMGGYDGGYLDTVEVYDLRPTAGSRWRACRKAWLRTLPQRWVARST